MAEVETIFFDLGGVVLTNGWDRHARQATIDHFGLDWEEFRDRHEFVVDAFETGQMNMDEYLERTVFYRERPFSQADFVAAMCAQSRPHTEALEVVERLAQAGKWLLATLNNESQELHLDRVRRFELRKYFTVFFTSGFLGVKKPEREIYEMALAVTQTPAERAVFIDDRPINLESALTEGMRAIHYVNPDQLVGALGAAGVAI